MGSLQTARTLYPLFVVSNPQETNLQVDVGRSVARQQFAQRDQSDF
jgi:hypothetical protein